MMRGGPAIGRNAWWLLGWITALLLVLVVPVDQAMDAAGATRARWLHAVGSVGAVVGALAIAALLPRGRRAWLGLVLVTAVVIRASYVGLLGFSGQGFTDEVFLHLEPESLRVAWLEYPLLVCVTAGAVLAALFGGRRLAARVGTVPARGAVAAAAVSLPLALIGADAMPEVQFAEAAVHWYAPRTLSVPEAQLARWRDSGWVEVDLLPKHQVQAQAPGEPINLILVYLESVGMAVVRHPRYPDLMPTLAGLLDRHGRVRDYHASAYITIEGLVNSMCGTLFPFRRGSEDMAGAELLADWMPCLGDVLREAGYRQTYLGGAGLAFAGKGAFLRAHGYDEVRGIDEWRARGLDQRPDTWGLSDSDLFEQSHAEIARLRAAGEPFHLTLLTIGTHLPGYRYSECAPYGDGSERFLDALSCTDQLLARWLQRLEAEGALDRTLVAITADHHIFPNPDMLRLFGEAAVYDRRLPLVLLGPELPALSATGAAYDLAPTLLDLLGIRHDARFALGRSLVDAMDRARPYFRKYEDVVDGRPAQNIPCEGPPASGVPQLPLSGCDKQELLELLAMQHARFSNAGSKLRCDGHAGSNIVEVPSTGQGALRVVLGGRDQSGRFLHNSRAVAPDRHGLYLLAVDAEGAVVERQHVPASVMAEAARPWRPGVQAWVVASVGEVPAGTALPEWMPKSDAPSAWLLSGSGELLEVASKRADGSAALVLDVDLCMRALAGTGLH